MKDQGYTRRVTLPVKRERTPSPAPTQSAVFHLENALPNEFEDRDLARRRCSGCRVQGLVTPS